MVPVLKTVKLRFGECIMVKMKRIVLMLLVGCVLTNAVQAALVAPAGAVASNSLAPSVDIANIIDPTDMNGSNQHVPNDIYNTWLNGNATAGWAVHQWAFIDLGSEMNVEEIHVWNYHEFAPSLETNTRSVKDFTLWVASAGAALPVPSGGLAGPFTNAVNPGWTQVTIGIPATLTQGPSSLVEVEIDATDIFSSLGLTNIQYIGFDIDSNYDMSSGLVGLAQVQVYDAAVPEPATLMLLGFGGLVSLGKRLF